MRLAFLGTGPFAIPTLAALFASQHELVCVVTQPSRIDHRSRSAVSSPIRELAQSRGVPLLDPVDINAPAACAALAEFAPELLVVADYGQILKPQVLSLAPLGAINLHGSLLPKYRGAAPVAWALWKGESETGVTVFRLTPGVDAGPILAQVRTPIAADETSAALEGRLAELGAPLVVQVVDALARGEVAETPQDPAGASRARRLRKSDGALDWAQPAEAICRQIRALQPWPKTYTHFQREAQPALRLIVDQAAPVAGEGAPGQVLAAGGDELIVAAGQAAVRVLRIQPAGKRVLSAAEFLRGYGVRPGHFFRTQEETLAP